MLYINLSDSSIEVIQTKKRMLGGEVVTALSRKDIPEGVIVSGKVEEIDKLLLELRDVFVSAYPKEIKDKLGCLLVSDKEVISFRSLLPSRYGYKDSDLTKKIIEEATEVLPQDPNEFEHFYKEIGTMGEGREILYTAMSKSVILQYGKLFETFGIKLKFLSPRSFAIFELLKSLNLCQEKVIYCDISKKNIEYLVFDKYGPILTLEPKIGHKTFMTETKEVIKKLSEKEISISKIILAGAGSIEIHAKEVSEELEIPVIKMGELIDSVLERFKLNLETGGIAKMLLAAPVGLMMLVRRREAPNFVKDLRFIKKERHLLRKVEDEVSKKEISVSEISDKKDEIKEEMLDQYRETAIITDEIVEHKRSSLLAILGSRLFIIIISAVLVFGLGVAVLSFFGKKSVTIPFFTAPAPTFTPTPTILPSQTPTPTIDPTLKRSDLKVSVQNGTDRTGYARETADYLEERKYENVGVSNADKDTYEKSIVKIKEEKKNYLPLLVNDLKDKIDTSTTASLSAEEKYDVIIILGKK